MSLRIHNEPSTKRLATEEIQVSTRPESLEDEVIALFDVYRAPVLRYLSSCRIPVVDAEEIVQEVFLALFRHLRAGKSRSNLPAWIFTVAHNLGMKFHSAAKHRSRYFADSSVFSDRFVSAVEDPEEQLNGKQRRTRILRIVDALSEQDRRCLTLRAEGLGYREIARILGLSLGSVANSMARVLSRVHEATRR